MMTVQSDLDIAKKAAFKALRTATRLKYSLMADAELARTLPALEARLNDAALAGESLELTLGELLDEV